MRWDLNDLYPSFESPEFAGDIGEIDRMIEDHVQWFRTGLRGDPGAVLAEAVRRLSGYRLVFERAITYCGLMLAVEAENAQAQAWEERLLTKDAGMVECVVRFRKYLAELGPALDEAIQDAPGLGAFAFFLRENRDYARYMLPDDVEKAISLMEITGSQAWSNLHNTLTSTLTADLKEPDGTTKRLTLPMVRNLAHDADPEVRRRAYEAELACYPKVERAVAAALNGIKGEALTKCRLRGFASPLDQTLFESRMDRETLDAMVGAMERYLPVFRKYLRAKARLLGHPACLPFYDLFAPVGSVARRYTLEEARACLTGNFRPFSGKMADFIDSAFERRWLDTEPREGKQGGAFCAGIHALRQSRILSNFDGSFNAVATLAHELGHAYHNLCVGGRDVLSAQYPMPLAETASIFNETFIYNKALEEATSPDERLGLLEGQLMDATQVVVDILSRYWFETAVFARRAEGALLAADLNQLMLDAQRRAYGDGLDEARPHPSMWICKGHYYMGVHFYNFPYAFGLLFGLGVYSLCRERGKEAFLPMYDELLAATGVGDVADVCRSVGIDVRDGAFWRGSLDGIAEKAEEFAALIEAGNR